MPNINKVVYGNQTLIDLTNSTLSSADQLAQGVTAYDRGGNLLTGTASGGTAAISVVDTTDSHGGTVRTITALDISDTTAIASDVAQGKYFYTADGTKTQGTSSGGGGGGITTATLTYSAWSDTPFNLYAPTVTRTYAKMSGVTEYLYANSDPDTVDILLYNGASYVHIDNTIESMSGDIEEDEDGYYFITGDCSIIIS